MKSLTVETIAAWLGWPDDANLDPLRHLESTGAPNAELVLPLGEDVRALLERLEVPPQARDEIIATTPCADRDPEAWWVLERLYQALTAEHGWAPPWPAPFVTDEALTHYFHLYVFLAAVPDVLSAHGARDISTEVTWSTLSDFGLQVANYELRNGRPGFDAAFWVWPHFRGEVFTLGRLQFDRDGQGVEGPALGVHIPALGPLLPEACASSLERARGFFADHFPEQTYRLASCQSWLLDEQLCEYLGEDSNIIAFQRRFTPVPDWSRPGDDDVVRFVFGRLPRSLDELPQETSVQRAVVKHLRDGRHWRFRRGWLEL